MLTDTHQVDEFGRSVPPQLVDFYENDEIICGDMCVRPAINWGRDDSKPNKI
jgi:hypothetical protein